MTSTNRTEEYRDFIQIFVQLWHQGLEDPPRTQARTLEWLLEGYARTAYGQQFDAEGLLPLADDPPRLFDAYRRAFPVSDYDKLGPWIDRVAEGLPVQIDGEVVDVTVFLESFDPLVHGSGRNADLTSDLGVGHPPVFDEEFDDLIVDRIHSLKDYQQ